MNKKGLNGSDKLITPDETICYQIFSQTYFLQTKQQIFRNIEGNVEKKIKYESTEDVFKKVFVPNFGFYFSTQIKKLTRK